MKNQVKITLAVALAVCAFVALHIGGSTQVSAATVDGKAIYGTNCASCHQATGEGVSGTFPPLAGNPDVTAAEPAKLIGAVVHGLNTPITVKGTKYSGGMPAWKGQLSNAEIAAVLTYIRSSWGNKAPAVTEKQVAAVK